MYGILAIFEPAAASRFKTTYVLIFSMLETFIRVYGNYSRYVILLVRIMRKIERRFNEPEIFIFMIQTDADRRFHFA